MCLTMQLVISENRYGKEGVACTNDLIQLQNSICGVRRVVPDSDRANRNHMHRVFIAEELDSTASANCCRAVRKLLLLSLKVLRAFAATKGKKEFREL